LRRELLIAAGPGEWRAAWLEDGAAIELHVERGDSPPPGSIHLGRVVHLVAGLGAAFIDVGTGRPGFLPLRRPVEEGSRVIVEVRREAQRGKGALLSQTIAEERRAPLAARAPGIDPPAQLDPPGGFATALALRLAAAPQRILSDDIALLPELRAAFPSAAIAHAGPAEWPLDLDAAFEAALAPRLALPGGGRLHIDETEAAVLIDVDTGSPETGTAERNAAGVNLAAAPVIAREMRRRQLGGGIIVDFAALDGRRTRERVREAVAAALAGDPAAPQVLGWTRLGHLEIVRPRRLRPLSEAMLEPHAARKTAAALAFECLRAAARAARTQPAADWRLVVAPEVAAALRGPAAFGLQALERRLGRPLAIESAPSGATRPFDIAAR
jgi:Ribonuclease G/E